MNTSTLFQGPSAWPDFAEHLLSIHAHRVFFVCGDTTWAKSGAAERVESLVAHAGLILLHRFAAFDPNPKTESVDAAYALARECRTDLLLAIGGGSAIDVAKGVLDRFLAEGGVQSPLLAAIPTTAGTGSEATRFSVLYKDGKKLSLDRPELRPSLVVLDPALTTSLPPYTTACSGLDAIAQAIEALWAVHSTPDSDAFAQEALTLLLPAIQAAVKTGNDFARACMLRGANLAGRAIDITRTTAAHAFSYAFTTAHGIPHGHAVWLSLPAVARYNAAVTDADCQDPRGAAFVRERLALVARRVTGSADPAALPDALRAISAGIGVENDPFNLGVANVTELRVLFSQANLERMANNPRAIDMNSWIEVFRMTSTSPT